MSLISFPVSLISVVVRCVQDAVGDDIEADVRLNDLKTRNSVPSRIWDLLNTNLIKSLDAEDCTTATSHRGPWEMLIIYERTSQCILTFMREKRFAELKRNQHHRKKMHYVDMLARQFNMDLLADQEQLCLIPHVFSDEDMLANLVQNLLSGLRCGDGVIQHHVLVLFDTTGYQLTHIRAVMITPSLDIAKDGDQDWSRFIKSEQSTVVETIENSVAIENQPNRGLSLTKKAIARKKSNLQIKNQESQLKGEA